MKNYKLMTKFSWWESKLDNIMVLIRYQKVYMINMDLEEL